jgi:hypothetical protein
MDLARKNGDRTNDIQFAGLPGLPSVDPTVCYGTQCVIGKSSSNGLFFHSKLFHYV